VLGVEDWAEIRRLHRAERMPIKVIARVTGVSRNTVRRALAAEVPPRYQRPARGSVVDAVEPQIRELLRAWPTMPATVIAERIGWQRSIRVLRDRVAELRPAYLPPDPASRTAYAAGELAQCDLWFPPVTLPVGFGQARSATRLPVLVMVSGYSRWLSARLLPSRAAEDLFAGWWQLLAQLGGVPKALVWDQEGAVGKRRRRVSVLTEAAQAFRGVLGARIVLCDPADPEAKGLVERDLRLAGGLQHPAGRLAHAGQPATTACLGRCAGRAHRGRPCGHAAVAAGRAGHRLASWAAAGP
jgi:transposase